LPKPNAPGKATTVGGRQTPLEELLLELEELECPEELLELEELLLELEELECPEELLELEELLLELEELECPEELLLEVEELECPEELLELEELLVPPEIESEAIVGRPVPLPQKPNDAVPLAGMLAL
jgi:ferredoxin